MLATNNRGVDYYCKKNQKHSDSCDTNSLIGSLEISEIDSEESSVILIDNSF